MMKTKVTKKKELKPAKLAAVNIYPDFPVYDSMDQCAGATGIPISALKLAKRQGCLFIRHGRVNVAEFIRWFFGAERAGNAEDAIDWTKRDKRAAALLKEVELEEEQNRVIDWSMVNSFITRLVSVEFFGELERLAGEFPASLKGKTEVEIAEETQKQIALIRDSMKNKMEMWKQKKGKS